MFLIIYVFLDSIFIVATKPLDFFSSFFFLHTTFSKLVYFFVAVCVYAASGPLKLAKQNSDLDLH